MLTYEEVTARPEQACKQQEEIDFGGFALPNENDYFALFRDWKMISCHINSLAELKVVEYVLQLTWGMGNPYQFIPLTTEAFMNGFVNEYNEQVDDGTGLSRQSVLNGIEKAMKHGLIERRVEYYLDENGITRATRYYGLHFYEPVEAQEETIVAPQEEIDETQFACDELIHDLESAVLEPDEGQSLNGIPLSEEIKNSNYLSNNNYCSNISRIQSLETLPERSYSNKPRGKSKYPEFIRSRIEQFSKMMGDHEHTASNISHATNIYLAYIANGGNAKAFTELMQQAREVTQQARGIKKKNKQGQPNRMPYFFSCLRKSTVAIGNC